MSEAMSRTGPMPVPPPSRPSDSRPATSAVVRPKGRPPSPGVTQGCPAASLSTASQTSLAPACETTPEVGSPVASHALRLGAQVPRSRGRRPAAPCQASTGVAPATSAAVTAACSEAVSWRMSVSRVRSSNCSQPTVNSSTTRTASSVTAVAST